jgi:hypothetical protein
MTGRGPRILILGFVIGGIAGALMGGLAAGWRTGMTARPTPLVLLPARATQTQPPVLSPKLNPKEFIPLPQTGTQDQPTPGAGGQDCDRIFYFYQGRLYQLRPGPTPRNGGNPEFYFMEPYQGPQIPGFPSPQAPGLTPPDMPGQPIPPPFKF